MLAPSPETIAPALRRDLLRILLVDDNPDDRSLVARELEREFRHVEIRQVGDGRVLDEALASRFDLVITDYHLRWTTGLDVLATVRRRLPECPVIMFTGTGNEEVAVAAMKAGLDDYIIKSPSHFVRLSAAARGVMERVHQRHAARMAEERYDNLFDDVPIGLFRATPWGRFLRVNPAMVQILGYADAAALLRSEPGEIFPADDGRQPLLHLLERGGIARSVETQLRRVDDTLVWVKASAHLVYNRSGDPSYIEGTVEDIDEWKRTQASLVAVEAQFRQAQKMEAVGRLAAGVAHDLNNLLTTVSGNAHLALRDLSPGHPARESIIEIEGAVQRGTAMTRQLTTLFRKEVLQPQVVDLNALVADMERLLHRLVSESIEIIVQLEPALGPVRADPGQLEQVLLNLVVNARDASGGQGRIQVCTRSAEMTVETADMADRYVVLSVRDDGEGIDPAIRDRIFEPFYTTKEAGAGTGLGLSTVYSIARQNGGFVRVESVLGEGAEFLFYLPCFQSGAEPAARVAPKRAAERPLMRETGTVLLVEDEFALRSLARRILERSGYSVIEAGDGVEALRIFRESTEPIDLLLTDTVMPRLGGPPLAAEIRKVRPFLPVVLMSGYSSGEPIFPDQEQGPTIYLQKPFSPDGLLSAVRFEVAPPPEVEPAGSAGART